MQNPPHIIQQTALHGPADRWQQRKKELAQLRIDEFMCREDKVHTVQQLLCRSIPLMMNGDIGVALQLLFHHRTPLGHEAVQQDDTVQFNPRLAQEPQNDLRLEPCEVTADRKGTSASRKIIACLFHGSGEGILLLHNGAFRRLLAMTELTDAPQPPRRLLCPHGVDIGKIGRPEALSDMRGECRQLRLLFVVLVGLLVLIQYPLWLGQGSWSRVWRLDQSLALQREVNAGKRLRNEGLEAEVEDLKSGRSAVEERARYGLGMVKPDEIFVQINPAPDSPATGH